MGEGETTFLLRTSSRERIGKKESAKWYITELIRRGAGDVTVGLVDWSCRKLTFCDPVGASADAKNLLNGLCSKLERLDSSLKAKVRRLKQMFSQGMQNSSRQKMPSLKDTKTGRSLSMVEHYGEKYINLLKSWK